MLTEQEIDAIANAVIAKLPKPDTEWVTAQRAMELLGISSKNTLHNYIIKGFVVANNPGKGGVLMVKKDSINRYFELKLKKHLKLKRN